MTYKMYVALGKFENMHVPVNDILDIYLSY